MNTKPWVVSRCKTCGSANVDHGSLGAERDALQAQVAELRTALEMALYAHKDNWQRGSGWESKARAALDKTKE